MAIVLLTSAGGSPGVTTVAVGLSLVWPRPVLLVDADPGAHQSILAGFLAGQSSSGKGLLRVAEAHRDRRDLVEAIVDQSLPLVGAGTGPLFLPGFTKPGSAGHFGPVWDDLAHAFDRLGAVGRDVIVDAGRLTSDALPRALADRSAATAMILGSGLRSVMSARVHLPSLREHPRGTLASERLGLIIVGEGEPYGSSEIARTLGVPVFQCVPRDPASAAHLSDAHPRPRKFDSSPLVRSLRDTAGALSRRLQAPADLIRS